MPIWASHVLPHETIEWRDLFECHHCCCFHRRRRIIFNIEISSFINLAIEMPCLTAALRPTDAEKWFLSLRSICSILIAIYVGAIALFFLLFLCEHQQTRKGFECTVVKNTKQKLVLSLCWKIMCILFHFFCSPCNCDFKFVKSVLIRCDPNKVVHLKLHFSLYVTLRQLGQLAYNGHHVSIRFDLISFFRRLLIP